MHLMGLHGKSFLPIFLGFGCNVPAVMGTRVINSRKARLLTILVAPLVPCSARMAVLAFIAPAFFGAQAALVSWGLIMLSLALLVVSGILLNRVLFNGERSAFIMELPLYHIPNARTLGLLIWQRSLSFLRKAGTIILAMSLAIWVLSVLPGGNLQTSFLARLGYLVAPVGHWMGLDWKLTVALLTSFLAKENAIATLGVLFGQGQNAGLAHTLAAAYSLAHRAGLPDRLAAVYPLRRHGRGDQAGNRLVALDDGQHRLYAGALDRRWQRDIRLASSMSAPVRWLCWDGSDARKTVEPKSAAGARSSLPRWLPA